MSSWLQNLYCMYIHTRIVYVYYVFFTLLMHAEDTCRGKPIPKHAFHASSQS